MRRHTRTIACGALIAAALLSGACRGERKSGDAAAAHQHGTATANPTATAVDHSAHTTSADPHAGMNHGTGATMDHSAHGAAAEVDHAAMGHGTSADPHAAHRANASAGAVDHSKMDHSASGHATQQHPSRGDAHGQHGATRGSNAHAQHRQEPTNAHAQHNTSQHAQHNETHTPAADAHAQHAATTPRDAHAAHAAHGATTSTAPAIAVAPRSSSELQRVQPAATLRPDAFDAPAPAAVSEARKATQGGGHEGHATRGITPGEDRENPPTPMAATRDRTNTPATGAQHEHHDGTNAQTRGAAQTDEAVAYYCPMDPEVTSTRPGSCHKCGMALVKKD